MVVPLDKNTRFVFCVPAIPPHTLQEIVPEEKV